MEQAYLYSDMFPYPINSKYTGLHCQENAASIPEIHTDILVASSVETK